ncbi:MAG: hypothetical protein WDN48_11165, partial [Pseudolabrys sp.]
PTPPHAQNVALLPIQLSVGGAVQICLKWQLHKIVWRGASRAIKFDIAGDKFRRAGVACRRKYRSFSFVKR